MSSIKFSYGINHTFNFDAQRAFLTAYKADIISAYIYIPNYKLAANLSCLHPCFRQTFSTDYYLRMIDVIKELGIKLNITLNSDAPSIFNEELIKELKIYKPDEICCCDNLFPVLKQELPNIKYYRSILSGWKSSEELAALDFDGYILRTTWPWEDKFINDKDNRIMIDFICYHNCRAKYCNRHGEHDIDESSPYYNKFCAAEVKAAGGLEKMLAHHIFLGRDIELLQTLYPNQLFTFKYASRMHNIMQNRQRTWKYLKLFDYVFDTYLHGTNEFKFTQDTLANNGSNCTLEPWYSEKFNARQFNSDIFYEEKLNWWRKLIPDLDKY